MRRSAAVLVTFGLLVVQGDHRATADDQPTSNQPPVANVPARPTTAAWTLYDRFCLACHGEKGDGAGPAAPWLWPRPRDFTRQEMKWRSTPSGQFATDQDLARAIRHGAAGTSMHAFGTTLTEPQVTQLVGVVRYLADQPAAETATPVVPPPAGPDSMSRGKALYNSLGCAQCHGTTGKGDGPSASQLKDGRDLPAPPFDLTRRPLRRPRAADEDATTSIYRTLVTGLDGTPMPSYQGAAPPADLAAVSAYVASLYQPGAAHDATIIDPLAQALDKGKDRVVAGHWPGGSDLPDAAAMARAIALMGPAPDHLAPAQASLSARQCARCHAAQVRQWRGSLHSKASSPGLIAQLLPMAASKKGRTLESCQRCHAPLAEQLPLIRPEHAGGDPKSRAYRKNPLFDAKLRDEGINCASCHVRKWRRLGPPRATDNKLLSLPGYPLDELAIYERSDFCLPCHQLEPSKGLGGKPLLNTYKEWLEGPYMARGVQCQHCHMPDREHTWKGVHDRDTVRQGISLAAIAGRSKSGAVSVRARLKNVGAGHYLPTTPTPAVWLDIDLVDVDGALIAGASASKRIGRHLGVRKGRFYEIEDTRIPPGKSTELARAWQAGRVSEAAFARVRVRVAPDDYYQGMYERQLARGKLTRRQRELFEDALARAKASKFVAMERLVPIARP